MVRLSKISVGTILSTILAACTPSRSTLPPITQAELAEAAALPKPDQEVAERAAKEYINRTLKDPSSVMYRNILPVKSGIIPHHSGEKTSGWFMCGEVNAKNSYGAYAGFTTFITIFSSDRPNFVIFGAMDNLDSDTATDWCNHIYNPQISA